MSRKLWRPDSGTFITFFDLNSRRNGSTSYAAYLPQKVPFISEYRKSVSHFDKNECFDIHMLNAECDWLRQIAKHRTNLGELKIKIDFCLRFSTLHVEHLIRDLVLFEIMDFPSKSYADAVKGHRSRITHFRINPQTNFRGWKVAVEYISLISLSLIGGMTRFIRAVFN